MLVRSVHRSLGLYTADVGRIDRCVINVMAKWSRVEHICLQDFGRQVKASKAVIVLHVHLFKTHKILEVIAVKASPTWVRVSYFSGHQVSTPT